MPNDNLQAREKAFEAALVAFYYSAHPAQDQAGVMRRIFDAGVAYGQRAVTGAKTAVGAAADPED